MEKRLLVDISLPLDTTTITALVEKSKRAEAPIRVWKMEASRRLRIAHLGSVRYEDIAVMKMRLLQSLTRMPSKRTFTFNEMRPITLGRKEYIAAIGSSEIPLEWTTYLRNLRNAVCGQDGLARQSLAPNLDDALWTPRVILGTSGTPSSHWNAQLKPPLLFTPTSIGIYLKINMDAVPVVHDRFIPLP